MLVKLKFVVVFETFRLENMFEIEDNIEVPNVNLYTPTEQDTNHSQ